MKWIVQGLRVGLVATALTSPAGAQMPADWTEPFEPVQIADNLFYVGSAGLSAFLLTSAEGHVLIDAPLEENTQLVLENVRALGFDPRDVQTHVVTHAHFDHVAGLPSMVRETGGSVLVSAADAPFIRAGEDFGLETAGYPPSPVSRTLEHLERIPVGDFELTAHVTPGHTPGCTSWSGVVRIAGEPRRFVLVCSLSALSAYRLGGEDPTYAGQGDDFCRSVEHLKTLDADIFLSNHSQFFDLEAKAEARRGGDASAFVDPGGLERFLETAAGAIDRARVGQGLDPCDDTSD